MSDEVDFRGWNCCPIDVLMLVLPELDDESLVNCLTLNRWWRDAVDYYAQHQNKWKNIAQLSMTNKGAKFRVKSSSDMSWRDLFYNSQLWRNVSRAGVKWEPYYVTTAKDIQVIHVFKDNLLVCCGEKEENIGGAMFYDLQTSCHSINKLVKNKTQVNKIEEKPTTVESTDSPGLDRLKEKLFHGCCSFTKYTIFDENCFYVLDEKNIMRRYVWNESEDKWKNEVLGRYYGCSRSIKDIHVYNGEVYILLKSGHVMQADRTGMNFENAAVLEFPPTSRMFYVRLIHSRVLRSLETAYVFDIPHTIIGPGVIFNKFSAVISAESNQTFTVTRQRDTDQFVIEVPELTSALEHGDILFLGYQDGTLDICKPSRLLKEGYIPELSLNVLNNHEHMDVIDDPAIVSIEVFEAKETHHLFVATRFNVYGLTLTYPERVKDDITVLRRQR